MYTQYFQEYLDHCKDLLLQSQHPEIQKFIRTMKKTFKEESIEHAIEPAARLMALDIVPVVSKESVEDVLAEKLPEFTKMLKYTAKSFVFKVELRHLEKHVYRIIEIPASMNLADMAYIVLASMQCDGSHMFSIDIKNETYCCEGCREDSYYDDLYAADFHLIDFHLRKGSHMTITYDFGDCFELDVTVQEIKTYQHIVDHQELRVLDGDGFGIWEDDHHAMEVFYYERERFEEFVNDQGRDIEWFPVDEKFDIDTLNAELIDRAKALKHWYER